MPYDYKAGKRRILDILNDTNEVSEVDIIPNDQEFTYNNGYYGWVSSIFVDIRNSTALFAENKKSSTARIIRSFASEIIVILKEDNNLREIGIRGDCVYAIYATPNEKDDYRLAQKAFYINSFMDMLNGLLKQKNMKTINVGIGLSTNQDLVIKAGRNKSKVNAKVWIGKAVTYASKLSNMANTKENKEKILMTSDFYDRIINLCCVNNKGKNVKSWFFMHKNTIIGEYYGCNIVMEDFDNWIKRGMKDGR